MKKLFKEKNEDSLYECPLCAGIKRTKFRIVFCPLCRGSKKVNWVEKICDHEQQVLILDLKMIDSFDNIYGGSL